MRVHLAPLVEGEVDPTAMKKKVELASSSQQQKIPSGDETPPMVWVFDIHVGSGSGLILPPSSEACCWSPQLTMSFPQSAHAGDAKGGQGVDGGGRSGPIKCVVVPRGVVFEWSGGDRIKVEVALRYYFPSEVAQYILAFALHDARYKCASD